MIKGLTGEIAGDPVVAWDEAAQMNAYHL